MDISDKIAKTQQELALVREGLTVDTFGMDLSMQSSEANLRLQEVELERRLTELEFQFDLEKAHA